MSDVVSTFRNASTGSTMKWPTLSSAIFLSALALTVDGNVVTSTGCPNRLFAVKAA